MKLGVRIALSVVAFFLIAPGITAISSNTSESKAKTSACIQTASVRQLASPQLSSEQAINATEIIAIGRLRQLSDNRILTLLMAAMQESKIMNLNYGDRDSLGLFQMRPSASGSKPYWGTSEQILNTTYAINRMYDELVKKVPEPNSLSLNDAAQKIEVSGFPYAYAEWEPQSRQLLASAGSSPLTQQAAYFGCGPGTPANVVNGGSPGSCDAGVAAGTANTYKGPAITLCAVYGIIVNAVAAKQVSNLVTQAAADGLTLTGGGFRSYEEQVKLRQDPSRHCADVYTAPAETCSPPTARPGASQHEQGLAIDFDLGPGVFNWLKGHAEANGFYNLPSEPWHWSTTGS